MVDMHNKAWRAAFGALYRARQEKIITLEEYDDFKVKLKDKYENEEELVYKDYSSYEGCLSVNEILDLLEKFSEMKEEDITREINKLDKANLYHVLEHYNWDDGFLIPSLILKNKNCDLALAMEIFELAEACDAIKDTYVRKKKPRASSKEWVDFSLDLYEKMANGHFKKEDPARPFPLWLIIGLLKKGIVNEITKEFLFLFDE